MVRPEGTLSDWGRGGPIFRWPRGPLSVCRPHALPAGALERLYRLYRGLLAAEARHHEESVGLARGLGVVSDDELRARIVEIAEAESEIVRTAPPEARLHGGVG